MPPDPLDDLRLSLMQDVLPVGLAALERVRRGGPQELIAAYDAALAALRAAMLFEKTTFPFVVDAPIPARTPKPPRWGTKAQSDTGYK